VPLQQTFNKLSTFSFLIKGLQLHDSFPRAIIHGFWSFLDTLWCTPPKSYHGWQNNTALLVMIEATESGTSGAPRNTLKPE